MNKEMPKGARIRTFTGGSFDVFNPKQSDLDISDIAHSLANKCRYGGHCLRFYSVAEHCVLLTKWVERNFPHDVSLQRWALMHDAAEAYIGDLPAPIKALMPHFAELEHRIMALVAAEFNLGEEPVELKAIDLRIRFDEAEQNNHSLNDGQVGEPLGISLHLWSPSEAEDAFCLEYLRLWHCA